MHVREPTKVLRSWTTDSTRWKAFHPRAGDIVVATAAKCGTTWTIQIANLLVEQSPAPQPIWLLSPWLDVRDYPVEQAVEALDAQTRRRVIKSHLPSNALPLYDDLRYIHVCRDGRDAFMSWFNHVGHYTPEVLAFMDEIGRTDPEIGRPHPRLERDIHRYFDTWMTEGPDARFADDMPAARYFAIERSFWRDRHLPNVLLVHYNDLKTDLDGEMRRISAFLDIPVNEAIWPSLVDAARFENMRESGEALMPFGRMIWEKGHETFFHAGTNARWRDVFTPAEIARYEERLRREFSPALAAWATKGRLATCDPRDAED
jgi:aryl sulfotransferase